MKPLGASSAYVDGSPMGRDTEVEAIHDVQAPLILNFIDQGSAAWTGRCHCHYNEHLRVSVGVQHVLLYLH